jgi:NADH-quinone oxidoreductase subunit L
MLPDLHEHPGLLFVAATLLPLASFLILLLVYGVWCLVRPYRDTEAGEAVYNLLGGDAGTRGGAYVALGAIAASFLLCLTGFIWFLQEQHTWEYAIHEQEEEVKRLEEDAKEAPQEKKEELEKQLKRAHENAELKEKGFKAVVAAHWKGRWDWLRVSPAKLDDPSRGTILQLGYKIDTLSGLMFVMVTFVASLIHLFSIGYMSEELGAHVADHQVHTEEGHLHRRGRFGRFFMYLSLFCFSMLNLVLADNLFQVFVSWELVGICSYLLIGFYLERQSASNASNKAFITNRIGDAGFIIGLLIIWSLVGSFNFEDIFTRIRCPQFDSHGQPVASAGKIVRANLVGSKLNKFDAVPGGSEVVLFPLNPPEHYHPVEHGDEAISIDPKWQAENPNDPRYSTMPYWMLVVAGLGVFLGCVGKSAQFPLQVWLPDAMEGPTPVSALIHAATMVAAGVYLVGRAFPLFTPEALLVIAYTGGITLFVAATIAVVMTDIKKVLAYSTVSQLGYMMLALGVGGWVAGLFHLLTHAFFKALLFLGSGSVIYGCHHEQDMLKMGGLYPKMKITALTMLMGVLAIAGIPGFSGWYSKDAVLASAYGFASVHREHLLLFILPLVTAGITTFYMFRMWFMTFCGTPRDEHVHEHAHETPWPMTTPLIVLGILSVCVAWGWPFFSGSFPFLDAESSWVEHQLHHSQPLAVEADFGPVVSAALANHALAGNLALGIVVLGLMFAWLMYYAGTLDPAEAKDQFPGVHAFLTHKWYFDELYSVVLVRPALVVANWFKAFDLKVIDGFLHAVARGTVWLARGGGLFDNGIIDGLANLIGNVFQNIGARLRGIQTGYLRSYVLFLVLAAVGIFLVLSYFLTVVLAGG